MEERADDPVAKTFDEAYQESAGSQAYDVLIQGANHFSIAHPLDDTTGRSFLDMPMSRPAAQIRRQIARLILAFLQKKPLNGKHIVVRRK
jgi:hypothetical protein